MNYYDRRRPRTFLRAKYRTPVFFVYALLILGVVIVCCLASWIGDGVGGIGGTLEHSIVDNNNKIPLVYVSRKLQGYHPQSSLIHRRQFISKQQGVEGVKKNSVGDNVKQNPIVNSTKTLTTPWTALTTPLTILTTPLTILTTTTTIIGNNGNVNTTSPAINESCEVPSIAEFPTDLFSQYQRLHGAFLVHTLVAVYMCVGLAIICDYYFIPSLEVICYRLDLQADVAGASFMAIGSSAPELFASVIGVFVTKGDIGIGTVLGSAIFNVLFVIGLCGILSSGTLQLAWWPVMRDGLCYLLSLIVLVVVIVDGEVYWLEAAIMLIIYGFYIALMWKNEALEKWFYLYGGFIETYEERFGKMVEGGVEVEEVLEDKDEHLLSEKEKKRHEKYLKIGKEGVYRPLSREDDMSSEDSMDAIFPDDPPFELNVIPPGCVERLKWACLLPFQALFYFTIPDIRRKRMRPYYGITFVMSIIWIGLTTYFLVWMTTLVGFTFGIPDAVMGLTFIAFGSSIPDAIASILVAKQGKGDMAVAQAMGSNVFDILLGLGLPWILKTLIFDLNSTIEVQSVGLVISCLSIFASVVLFMVLICYYQFKLVKRIGVILVVVYVVFLVISVLLEVYVWVDYHLPTCHFPS